MLKTDLIKGNILSSLVIFAIPLIISNVFQQLYNTADIMIVGHYLGDTSLAAIGASTVIFELLVGFTLGFGNGLSIVVARNFGSGNKEAIKKSVALSLIIGLVITIIITVSSRFFLYPLLKVLKTPETILKESYVYISTITLFIVVMFGYNLCAGLLRAIGNSFAPLAFLIISSLLNIVLAIFFIVNMKMGINGAAIATAIAQGISVILCLLYIKNKAKILIPSKRHFKNDSILYKELISQGLSMALMSSIVSLGSVVLQSSINNLGFLTIAGHSAARKLFGLSIIPFFALGTALSTFVSQNRGAEKGDRIIKAVKYVNIIGITWSLFVFIILMFTARFFIHIISGSEESIILNNGSKYLRLSAPFYIVLAVLINLRFALQGLGEKIIPLISSFIEFIGKILFVIFIIPHFDYTGVILCEPIIWCFMTIQLVYAFYRNPYILKFKNNKLFGDIKVE